MKTRNQRIEAIKDNPNFDVLIIGAGINGIGTFFDLAHQGLRILLIDKNDYCSGASAASSHMVHGGIRYLENGEFRLVREAVEERNRLIENAPHLVKPLATTFPIFNLFSGLLNAPLKFLGWLNKPSERGAFVIKIGMLLYDLFTRKQKTVPKHIFTNREKSLKKFPLLNPKIISTATYFDGSMPSPERIAIELLTDAKKINPEAIALNYSSANSVSKSSVIIKNELSGELLTVYPKIVVNAGGAWIDNVNDSMGIITNFIGGTKGSHLVLNHPELRSAIGNHEIFFENKDGRIVLIFPLEDKVLIGTSDIKIDNPDEAIITDQEVDYFFEMILKVFPLIIVDRSHIVFTFSGVRPLPKGDAKSTGQISRDHQIKVSPPNQETIFPIYSLVGGKWTTYRAFSAQVSDVILEYLQKIRITTTDNIKIGGAKYYPISTNEKLAFIEDQLEKFSVNTSVISNLFEKYGTQIEEKLGNNSPLEHFPDFTIGEIEYIIKNEDVIHLDDLILRRTLIGMLGKLSKEGLHELGKILGNNLDWNDEKIQAEIVRVETVFLEKYRMVENKFQ